MLLFASQVDAGFVRNPRSDTRRSRTIRRSQACPAKTALAGLGGATFSADTVIITGSSSSFFVGSCDNASGKVTITSGNHHNSLVLVYTGLACFTGSILSGAPVVINMSYAIDSANSTGKFAGATGTGSITGSEAPSSGNILGNANGNILFP